MTAFDADRLAALETDMWQAYYQKENLRLFKDLVVTLREQYRYTWARSLQASFHLTRAAATFARLRGEYERVLPDLVDAYAIARHWTNSRFDPRAVARAELAWWVARRVPGASRPEQVGALIAAEYALLYGVPPERVARAGLLRARAAFVRDEGGERADWTMVRRLLGDAYRELARAVRPNRGSMVHSPRAHGRPAWWRGVKRVVQLERGDAAGELKGLGRSNSPRPGGVG